MKAKIQRTEGGQGGNRGHSGMSHYEYTEIIKSDMKVRRRKQSKEHILEQEMDSVDTETPDDLKLRKLREKFGGEK
jgi:hypothetical protein